MEKFVLILATLLLTITQSGDALKCYNCYSQKDAKDCRLNSGTYDCEGNDVTCYNAVHKMYGIELHYKGCVKREQCNSYKICGALPNDRNCKLNCCDSDHCNASNTVKSFTMFSVFVTFLTTVLLIFS